MTTTLSTPKSMTNSIWTRPEVKKSSKNWSFKRGHERNRTVSITRYAKPTAGGIEFDGVVHPNFAAVKAAAADAGITHVEMGAIRAKVS